MSREYGPTKVRSESCDFSSIRSRDDAGDPIPDRSLRPLLPSVQILFDFFFQSRTRSHPAPDITTPANFGPPYFPTQAFASFAAFCSNSLSRFCNSSDRTVSIQRLVTKKGLGETRLHHDHSVDPSACVTYRGADSLNRPCCDRCRNHDSGANFGQPIFSTHLFASFATFCSNSLRFLLGLLTSVARARSSGRARASVRFLRATLLSVAGNPAPGPDRFFLPRNILHLDDRNRAHSPTRRAT